MDEYWLASAAYPSGKPQASRAFWSALSALRFERIEMRKHLLGLHDEKFEPGRMAGFFGGYTQ